eukprot:scaffold3213_cov123-Cylindrotheca_fusiformis.AAC.3
MTLSRVYVPFRILTWMESLPFSILTYMESLLSLTLAIAIRAGFAPAVAKCVPVSARMLLCVLKDRSLHVDREFDSSC